MELFLRVLRFLTLTFLVASFVWGMSVYGATQTERMYRLFLLFAIGTAVSLSGLLGRAALQAKGTASVILGIGLFLAGNVIFRSTVEAEGYTLLFLGWSAFFLSWVIASGSLTRARWLAFFIIVFGLLEAAYGFMQAVVGWDVIGDYNRRLGDLATGTFINRNHFAGFVNMAVAIALGCLYGCYSLSRKNHRSETVAKAWLILGSGAFMGLVVLLSQSRFGAAGFLLTLLAAGGLLLWRGKRDRGRKAPAAAIVLLILLTVVLGLGVGIQGLLSRIGDRQSGLTGRATVYMDTLKMIRDHPLAGVGPKMYQWRFRPYQSSEAQVWYDYAHNDYLQMAAEWGVPAALLFWGFVVALMLAAVSRFLSNRLERWRRGIALGCAAAVFSILLHSFVDFNLYIPVNWMLFCGILGLAFAEGSKAKEQPAVRKYYVDNG